MQMLMSEEDIENLVHHQLTNFGGGAKSEFNKRSSSSVGKNRKMF